MRKISLGILFLGISITLLAQDEDKNKGTAFLDSIRSTFREQYAIYKPAYNADSVRKELEQGPYFTLYKDNYFIGGSTIGHKMTAANSNVKFQLSVRQKLTRSKLPFDTYLYIQFTQKTIWNVLENSMPMYDLNFNPGIGLGYMIIHQNRYVGNAYLMLEHESNGKNDEASRSWNRISFGGSVLLSHYLETQLKAWIPIIDGQNNRDILKYNGLAQLTFNYRPPQGRFNVGLITTWRTHSFSFNTQWEVSYRINRNENQHLFIQYYNGYGECLLDYNKYKSMLRIGFVIKPQWFSMY